MVAAGDRAVGPHEVAGAGAGAVVAGVVQVETEVDAVEGLAAMPQGPMERGLQQYEDQPAHVQRRLLRNSCRTVPP